MNIQTSLNQTNEVFPIKDLYHRIDMSAINQNLDTCQHYGQQSTSSKCIELNIYVIVSRILCCEVFS